MARIKLPVLRMGLHARIMTLCIGLTLALELVTVFFVRRELSKALSREYLLKGRAVALSLAAQSEHYVLTEDVVALSGLVKRLVTSVPDVTYAYVTDRRGRVLAHTFKRGFPAGLLGVNSLSPEREWSMELLDTPEEGLVQDIAAPVLGGRAGAVHVGVSEQRIRGTITRFARIVLIIAVCALVIAGGLAATVSWFITRPVVSLTRAAERISRGELGQQVMATSRDEIGELVASFNRMSQELLRQHAVVEDRNQRIETGQRLIIEERDKLRAIIDSMAEGLIFVDAEGTIRLCNGSAERLWGHDVGPLVGTQINAIRAERIVSSIREGLTAERDKPGSPRTRAIETGNEDLLGSYTTVFSEDGRFLGIILLTLDVSERTALERDRKELRNQLFQQEKLALIGQIAASVAHELNTPLSTVLLRTQLMQRQSGHHLAEELKVVEREAKRCRGIVDSLLGFSRRAENEKTAVDLNSLILDCVSLLELDLARKGITLPVGRENAIIISADRNQIQQVLLNLITNAADAMPSGGTLAIRTRIDDRYAEIRVIDSGHGMDEDVVKHAFEPFFTTKERGRGTGLGLAICQRIVREHGGAIDIQSCPGRGTTVTVQLPRT